MARPAPRSPSAPWPDVGWRSCPGTGRITRSRPPTSTTGPTSGPCMRWACAGCWRPAPWAACARSCPPATWSSAINSSTAPGDGATPITPVPRSSTSAALTPTAPSSVRWRPGWPLRSDCGTNRPGPSWWCRVPAFRLEPRAGGSASLVTDYDAGLEADPKVAAVQAHDVMRALAENVTSVRTLLAALIPRIPEKPSCTCQTALARAKL